MEGREGIGEGGSFRGRCIGGIEEGYWREAIQSVHAYQQVWYVHMYVCMHACMYVCMHVL